MPMKSKYVEFVVGRAAVGFKERKFASCSMKIRCLEMFAHVHHGLHAIKLKPLAESRRRQRLDAVML